MVWVKQLVAAATVKWVKVQMNYSELVQAIKDYTEYEEASFVANIPTFIKQAEEKILRSVEIPELRKNVAGVVAVGNPYLARPSDFIYLYSLAVRDSDNVYTYLYNKDRSFIREAYPDPSVTGKPKYYAFFNGSSATSSGNFILTPSPDQAYTVELSYAYDPPSIVDSADNSSWLGDNAETVLLYGSLLEAYTYMKGEDSLMAVYNQRYQEALAGLETLGVKLRTDKFRAM